MTVQVQCPSCEKTYNVKDESLGARARCKNCGADFTVAISLADLSQSREVPPLVQGAADGNTRQPSDTNPSVDQSKSSAQRSSSDAAAKQPKRLGNYIIEKRLGAGGMGVVYLARDPVLDRKVAIKVLPASLSRDEQRLKRFLREAKLAAKLNHTHAATVYQAGAEGKMAYMAMEYVEGKSLDRSVSKKQPMNWREATRVIRDAASGLGAAHKIGLVHRDIKPGNLMRTPDGVTKVVDFGLARGREADTQLTQEGALLGTPSYMAPEQWKGEAIDGRTDLYSLICTYYYLLTGYLPFDVSELAALAYQHQCGDFPDPRERIPDLPDGICRILARGAAKQPDERFQTAEELVEELDVLLVCPDESLTFGSSWANLGALDLVQSSGTDASSQSLPSVAIEPEAKVQTSSGRSFRIPPWAWMTIAGGAGALLLLLAVVMLFSTKHGTVQITLHNADENVKVSLDGDTITVDGLNEPLKLKVGEHNLVASSPNFETVTRSFQVKRDETAVVDIEFVPKAVSEPVAQTPEPIVEPPARVVQTPESIADPPGVVASKVESAEYHVTVDPPEAVLAASGTGVSVSGTGVRRTVTVEKPDGNSIVALLATLDGYETLQQEIRPMAGELRDIALKLEKTAPLQQSPVAKPGDSPQPSYAVAPFDEAQAKQHQRAWAEYLGRPVKITNSIGMELVLIPPGEFDMGSADTVISRALTQTNRADAAKYGSILRSQAPVHRVKITKPFYLGLTEVTQQQYELVMNTNPSLYKGDSDRPVDNVAWDDAVEFCRKLSTVEDGVYQLPTEAQWEYACRAGTTTLFGFGNSDNTLDQYAYWNHPRGPTTVVGSLRPNPWDLRDMHGNMAEWCSDWYSTDYYHKSPAIDPAGPEVGSQRVVRGGCWGSGYSFGLTSAYRISFPPSSTVDAQSGIRVVMMIPEPKMSGSLTVDTRIEPKTVSPTAVPRRSLIVEPSHAESSNLPDGCVVAYSFDQDTIFTQGSQRYVRDLSGNDRHGVLNKVAISDGKVGTAAEFAGRSDCFIGLPAENGQYPVGDLTITAWVKKSETQGTILDLNFATSSISSFTGGAAFGFTGKTGCGFLYFAVPGRGANYTKHFTKEGALPSGRWTHIAAVRNRDAVAFFVDGTLAKKEPTPYTKISYNSSGYDDNSVNIGIWKRHGESSRWELTGSIDEFALFDRALSEQEIADIYNQQAGR